MTEPATRPPNENQLLQEAAIWFARMRGPDAEDRRSEFEAWLARGALHRRAYNRVAEIFAMGKVLGDEEARNMEPTASVQKRSRPLAYAALSVAAVAAFWILLRPADVPGLWQTQPTRGGTQVAELIAAAGAPEEFRLADNSLICLQPGTRIAIAFDASTRRLALRTGKARFEVAHEVRPFVVFAGGGSVTAHGTIFDVGLSSDRRVSVRLVEGVVDVRLPSSAKTNSRKAVDRRLRPGEVISYAAASAGTRQEAGHQATKSIPVAEASQQRAHDYDGISVGDLITQANFGASRPIRLAAPGIAQQRMSGRFSIDDTGLLAERIAALFHLVLDRSDPTKITLRSQRR